MPRLDLTGQRFGRLVALEPTYKNGKTAWVCKCDCGVEKVIDTSHLRQGDTKSCGCLHKEKARERGLANAQNLLGKRFGKLTVIEKTERRYRGSIVWKCRCDCGDITYVRTDILNSPSGTRSCGHCNNISRGEEKIRNILKDNNINFMQEKTFNDCYNPETNVRLRFDFYLPDYNCCIEYDGIQHFEGWSNSLLNLRDNKYRDNIKEEYCKNNNIRLIRIPYTDFDKISISYLESFFKQA